MYTVTRQSYWPDGDPVVEVAVGGIDFVNPDALVAKYPGEFKSFWDPRQAIKVAIEICQQWREDGEPKAQLAIGNTGGFTIPFEPTTFEKAIKWAEEEYETLEDDVFRFLDGLRVSGVTNMFGAGQYIQEMFEVDRIIARKLLAEWMRTFAQRHPKEE